MFLSVLVVPYKVHQYAFLTEITWWEQAKTVERDDLSVSMKNPGFISQSNEDSFTPYIDESHQRHLIDYLQAQNNNSLHCPNFTLIF